MVIPRLLSAVFFTVTKVQTKTLGIIYDQNSTVSTAYGVQYTCIHTSKTKSKISDTQRWHLIKTITNERQLITNKPSTISEDSFHELVSVPHNCSENVSGMDNSDVSESKNGIKSESGYKNMYNKY